MTLRQRLLSGLRRFHRDEGGQGVFFAAASMIVLIAFVSLAFNVGAAVGLRTRIQQAADSMVHSGAVVQANALSTVAWINSGMAQAYYHLMRQSADLGATAVAAELERRLNMTTDGSVNTASWQGTEAYHAYGEAKSKAQAEVPLALEFLRDLSRVENAVAIVTPELMWDEMFDVGKANGAERIALFPYQRMFPHESGEASYRIEKLSDGWRITNLNSQNGEFISVRLIGGEWHIKYSSGDSTTYEWVISQEGSNRWRIRLYDSNGDLSKEIYITQTDDGWIVTYDNAQLTLQKVQRGGYSGTAITYNGVTEIIRLDNGRFYKWDPWNNQWVDMTQDTLQIGDYTLNVHSSNTIRVGPMSVSVGDPPHVSVGGASMTLSDPPWISVSAGGISIGIHGFSENDYSISFQGHSLTNGNADGKWHLYFSNDSKLWWRHRLTEQAPINADALQQWQYDHQTLGAVMRYENRPERFGINHAILDSYAEHGEYAPADLVDSQHLWEWKPELQWTRWFDPAQGKVRDLQYRQNFSGAISHPSLYTNPTPSDDECRDKTFFLTKLCHACGGSGWYQDALGTWRVCNACGAKDHDGDGLSDIRVFLGEVVSTQDVWSNDANGQQTVRVPHSYIEPKPFSTGGDTRWPLVLSEEFFRWGVNAGSWRAAESAPMVFKREPDWGYVAIASARIGVGDALAEGDPAKVRYRFKSADEREDWVDHDDENFYRADLAVKLVSSRAQIADFDLDETILQGTSLGVTAESGTAFLWRAIVSGRYDALDEASLWFNERNGQSDYEMSSRLGNMRNRAGNAFDYGSAELENVIRH